MGLVWSDSLYETDGWGFESAHPLRMAYSGKFMRRRDRMLLPLGYLLRVLGANGLGAGLHILCLFLPSHLSQQDSIIF